MSVRVLCIYCIQYTEIVKHIRRRKEEEGTLLSMLLDRLVYVRKDLFVVVSSLFLFLLYSSVHGVG